MRPHQPDARARRLVAEHESLHGAADIWYGLPLISASIDLGAVPGSDRHGEVTADSDEILAATGVRNGDHLMRVRVLVARVIAYMGPEQQRWGYLPNRHEMTEWPPRNLREAADDTLEAIGVLVRAWSTTEDEWTIVLNLTHGLLADPEFMALAGRIADALLDKQTLLADDLHRIASPALDRAWAKERA
jgi:hypothetical protein